MDRRSFLRGVVLGDRVSGDCSRIELDAGSLVCAARCGGGLREWRLSSAG